MHVVYAHSVCTTSQAPLKCLSLSQDGTVKLWHTRSLQHVRTMRLSDGSGWINSALYVRGSKRLLLASALGKLMLLRST